MKVRRGVGDAVIVAASSGFAIAVWLGFAEFRYAPSQAVAGAVLLACLVGSLHAGSRFLGSYHALLQLPGSILVGTAVVWHVREQLRVPQTVVGLGAAIVAFAAVHYVATRLLGPASRRASLFATLVGVVATAALVGGALAENTMRWHLLRHLTVVGTPVYYAFLPPLAESYERAWARMRSATGGSVAGSAYRLEPAFGPNEPLPPAGAASPNIVLVLVDTLRADSFAAYGGDPRLMPRMNEIAERAFVFTDVRANASWTHPSVASYFTGKLQEMHGATGVTLPIREGEVTLAERLSEAGYATAAFVTNYEMVSPEGGFAQGFDAFVRLEGTPGRYVQAEGVNERVLAYLDERSEAGAPLFLYLHYLDPHYPYLNGGEQEYVRAIDRDLYDHELRYLDRHLAPFVEQVRSRLARPTIFLFVADHGEEFGEHESIGHGSTLYWEQVDVPAILSIPGGGQGRIPARLEGRDMHDLLLSLAREPQLDVRAWSEGASRPLRYYSIYHEHSTQPLHRPYFATSAIRAVDSEDQVLIWSVYGDTFELYDERADPRQTFNRYAEGIQGIEPLRALFDLPMARSQPNAPVELDDEDRARLRALGYVE